MRRHEEEDREGFHEAEEGIYKAEEGTFKAKEDGLYKAHRKVYLEQR